MSEHEFRFYLEDTEARALVVPPGTTQAARDARARAALQIAGWTSVLVSGETRTRGPSRRPAAAQGLRRAVLGAGTRTAPSHQTNQEENEES